MQSCDVFDEEGFVECRQGPVSFSHPKYDEFEDKLTVAEYSCLDSCLNNSGFPSFASFGLELGLTILSTDAV